MREYESIAFQVTRRCNMKCPHCFTVSDPTTKEAVSLETALSAINELRQAEIKPGEFIITGGEPTIWLNQNPVASSSQQQRVFTHSNTRRLMEVMRTEFTGVPIRLDTNGLLHVQYPAMFEFLAPDTYHLSIDTSHNRGLFRKDTTIVEPDGNSPLLNVFLDMQQRHGFDIYARWSAIDSDRDLWKKFSDRYSGRPGLKLKMKPVTRTGRAKEELMEDTNEGSTMSDNPADFACLFGKTIVFGYDGKWYGCYHTVSLTQIEKGTLAQGLEDLEKDKLVNVISTEGVGRALSLVSEQHPCLAEKASELVQTKYSFRCEPCAKACDSKVFARGILGKRD